MSYFHTGTRTIIGAEVFHGPVRDGKGWDHLAMVIRHNLLPAWLWPGEPIHRVLSACVLIAFNPRHNTLILRSKL